MPGLKFRGINLCGPINRLSAGEQAIAANVRQYLLEAFTLRNPLSGSLIPAPLPSVPGPQITAAIHTIKRLNDSTPNGPSSGYSWIIGAGTSIYCYNEDDGLKICATGLSGNPVSMVPFRPNASVQPWMYIADSAPEGQVTLFTTSLYSGLPVEFTTNGMLKINSRGVAWKMGGKEPQLAPVVSTTNGQQAFGGIGALHATAIPWTNFSGVNSTFNYGESNGFPNPTSPDGTAPFIVNCLNATSITITALSLDGTVVINGTTNPTLTTQSATRVTSGAPGYPGQFIQVEGSAGHPSTASYVIGAFTDGSGNVLPAGVAPLFISNIVDVGLAFSGAVTIPVPFGATAFQIGISSVGNTFSANSGLITIQGTVTTNALPSVLSTLGNLQLSYWGDSPTTGPVGSYIWKNSGDTSGGGPVRSNTAASGTAVGNSFIFDATFTAGIPSTPGVGTNAVAMQWTTLNPDSVATGSAPVFPAPLTSTYPNQTQYANFNFSVTGSIYFPAAGNYTLVLTSHDDCIIGIGGGVKLVSATASGTGEGGSVGLSNSGQTLSALLGLPLLPRQNYTSANANNYAKTTIVIHVATPLLTQIEIDFDYFARDGRILLLEGSATPGGSPTIIPPLPTSVRQNTQYRYVYRSSAIGAPTNPSPESTAEAIPVNANTISSIWSPDPQFDVVDYYRIDSATANYTYVGTGPNDDLGGSGTNTPITDALTDLQLGTQLLAYDNFEPFPSIDLPQKGTCSISGGVITWLTGGAIGGTETGFNLRWLAGTTILIGSPTSLAYTFIARPTSTTTVTIPGVPDAINVAYEIPEPTLAAQPMPYLFGPTDNINFFYGVGDPIRPGVLYWCNGSNPDAAADTNQMDVTDPGEPLISGAMSAGRGVLMSIARGWIIAPNFFNALATATGTQGSTWSLKATAIDRGLFMPRCIVVVGGGTVFFRVEDGIDYSPGGQSSKSITDAVLYNLFPHEGSTPVPVVRNGVTIYPPDDTQPQLQKFSNVNQFIYWDYMGTDSVPHTLTFDIEAMAWVWDIYDPPATIHAPNEGESQQGTLVGCYDGTLRLMQSAGTGTEAVVGTVMSPAVGGKGFQHIGAMVVEYTSTLPITLSFVVQDTGNGSYGPDPVVLPSTGGANAKYFFKPSPNKWKLLSFQFQSSDPNAVVYLEGFAMHWKQWGALEAYAVRMPFADTGGDG